MSIAKNLLDDLSLDSITLILEGQNKITFFDDRHKMLNGQTKLEFAGIETTKNRNPEFLEIVVFLVASNSNLLQELESQ